MSIPCIITGCVYPPPLKIQKATDEQFRTWTVKNLRTGQAKSLSFYPLLLVRSCGDSLQLLKISPTSNPNFALKHLIQRGAVRVKISCIYHVNLLRQDPSYQNVAKKFLFGTISVFLLSITVHLLPIPILRSPSPLSSSVWNNFSSQTTTMF